MDWLVVLEQFADYHRVGSTWAADFSSRYQIWCKNFIDAQIMGQKRNSTWRPPPSWIYFQSLFLTYSRLSTFELNHHTKFRANISIGGWLMVTFQTSRWRPSAILELLYVYIRPPTKPLRQITSACKILCQSNAYFWRYWDLNFLQIWLEMLIHAPKFGFWGVNLGKFTRWRKMTPRKLICTETRHWMHWASSHGSQGKLGVHSRN